MGWLSETKDDNGQREEKSGKLLTIEEVGDVIGGSFNSATRHQQSSIVGIETKRDYSMVMY
jgi:hypothetical protein